MKINKILTLIIVMSLCSGSVISAETAYKTACPFVRVTTNMLGYNFIARKIAQSVLKKSLSKTMKGDLSVKFDSFSGVDMKKGKFRGLTISGENLCVEDEVYITKMFMETTSDFNYVDYTKEPIEFKTDVPMDYTVEISESDLNKTMTTGSTFDVISSLLPLVSIEKPKLKLEKEKIRINSGIKFPFGKTIKFSMSAGMKVENGKVVLTNVNSTTSNNDFAEKLVELINKNNVLENMKIGLVEGADTIVKVKDVKIDSKKILVNGSIVIKKAE